MGKLSDIAIRNWIKRGEHFEQRGDGDGLYLRYREADKLPLWQFRYRFGGKQRLMIIASYGDMSLADARKQAKTLRARVALGEDVAASKQAQKREARGAQADMTIADLAEKFFAARILGRWKHPNLVRARIERDIRPAIGHIRVTALRTGDVEKVLDAVKPRGPTTANETLGLLKRMLRFAILRGWTVNNAADHFEQADAGGEETSRDRALTRDELVALFKAMHQAKGFSVENALAVRLLLMLAVRKQELIGARWAEFDLDAQVWNLPSWRVKTRAATAIPLPHQAVTALRTLRRLACGSPFVFPAKRPRTEQPEHASPSTLNVALGKVKHGLEPFVIHDLRRTARTLLSGLGVLPHVAEACLNHAPAKGIRTYDQHDYFDERRAALAQLADLLDTIEGIAVGDDTD